MRKYAFLVCALLVAVAVKAQTNGDSQARKIVDKAVAQFQRTPQLYQFTTTYTAGRTGEKHVQRGRCAISGKKSYLEFSGVETFFDGKTQWVYMPQNDEVSVSEPTPAEQREVNPLLLLGDYAKTHRVGFDEASDAKNFLICLYPTVAQKADYFRIKLTIEKSTYRVRSIEFFQRNADRILLVVNSQTAVPQSVTFSFDKTKHPNVEVVDMR